MNAIKIMGAALLLLFVLNVVSLALLLRLNHPHERAPRPAAAAEFLMRDLRFNPTQRKYYEQLIKLHREKIQHLEQERGKLRRALFAGIAQNDTSAIQDLRQLEGAFEWVTFQHFQAVRRIATPPQQERFDRVILEVGRRMMPKGEMPRKRHLH